LPKIQEATALQSSKVLQKYLNRMRGVYMPEYSKLNKPIVIDSMKHLLIKKNTIKKQLNANDTAILETIDRYVEILRVVSSQKSSLHYRRLIKKVEDIVHTYPNISNRLFEEKDKGLMTDPDVLK
jgi:hypothetical protein